MQELDERIHSLDISLFEAIPSETSMEDKKSLLLLQRCIRSSGDYTFLEIGSHLGGTIQPYYVDPLCSLIYSIDKRPLAQPDERGKIFKYPENSTAKMLGNLRNAYPSINDQNIITFDRDSSEVDRNKIAEKPEICFIDGEHTNTAVFSDFKFCLEVCHANAIIAFHDANLVFEGIEKIKSYLFNKSIRFQGFVLGGNVYAILLNEAAIAYADEMEPFTQNETEYFKTAREELFRTRLRNRSSLLYKLHKLFDKVKKIFN